jgi:hypothetical protein
MLRCYLNSVTKGARARDTSVSTYVAYRLPLLVFNNPMKGVIESIHSSAIRLCFDPCGYNRSRGWWPNVINKPSAFAIEIPSNKMLGVRWFKGP